MTVDDAFANVYHLNRAMTRLIALGNKIDAHQHPQQVDAVFAILKIVDTTRIQQIKVAKNYKKTADRLGELRRWYDDTAVEKTDVFSSFINNVNDELGLEDELAYHSSTQSTNKEGGESLNREVGVEGTAQTESSPDKEVDP